MFPVFHLISFEANTKYPEKLLKDTITFASDQDYQSQARGKFTKLTEIFYPTNVAMNLSGVDDSRYDRTYLKMNEMWRSLKVDEKDMKSFIDVGADPGMFSIYMLVKKLDGVGISIPNPDVQDKIRSRVIDPYYKSKKYEMIQDDFFNVDLERDLSNKQVDIITCDIGRGGDNSGKWDSYNKGLGFKLNKLLKSRDFKKMSDFEFHILVLDKCIKMYELKRARYMIVKMFNINDLGYVYNPNTKSTEQSKVGHKDRLWEYIQSLKDRNMNVYIHKPVSSQPTNNEFYLIITGNKIPGVGKVSWNGALEILLINKLGNLNALMDFFNNVSIEVFQKSKKINIDQKAREYLHESGLPLSFDQAIKKKVLRRVRF